MLDLLENLCNLCAVSGDENDVRNYIKAELKNIDCEIESDNLGNLIIFKKGKNRPKNKVAIFAHMDEVGFVASGINSEGFISLTAVGGISDCVVFGRKIRFKSGVIGVLGGKPVHLLSEAEKEKQPSLSELYADIGALYKEDAQDYVKLGDTAYFVGDFMDLKDGFIKSKAIDDRLGCAVMLDLLKSELEYDMYFVFTVQEEVGTRGAGVAAHSLNPDFALVLEATTACDIPGVENEKQVCKLGHGTVVPFMDKGTVYDKELYNLVFETAAELNLKCQTKTQILGANDSAAIHKTIGGVRTICLSAPCRYLHSPSCAVNKTDLLEMRILTEKSAYKIANK
ncbi:MAG: M42 family peptidase [Oscillospiraceae bacterium]|nr:M42 family peptidase [Oscillospiraceae bacterium]